MSDYTQPPATCEGCGAAEFVASFPTWQCKKCGCHHRRDLPESDDLVRCRVRIAELEHKAALYDLLRPTLSQELLDDAISGKLSELGDSLTGPIAVVYALAHQRVERAQSRIAEVLSYCRYILARDPDSDAGYFVNGLQEACGIIQTVLTGGARDLKIEMALALAEQVSDEKS